MNLKQYLRNLDKPAYIKSHEIAEDLDRSTKSVGKEISRLTENSADLDFEIEKWSTSHRGYTWKISND